MTVRIGLVGIGGLGYLQAKTYAEIEDVTIIAGADVSPDARALFEEQFGASVYAGHDALLAEHGDDLDAVSIVTPHTLHYEQVGRSLDEGCNVLVEKPMVTDVADAADLVDRARAQDLVLQVGYQRHFHPAFREIRRVLHSGRIGDLHAVNCHLGQDWIGQQRGTWRTDLSLSGGGQLYDTGSHLLDALLWTTDTSPGRVVAQMEYASPGIDVNAALTVRLKRGDDSVLASVGVTGDGMEITPSERYTYWGTEGRLEYADGHISVAEKGAATYDTEIEGDQDFQTLNRRKLENFVQSVEGTADPAVPGEVGLQVTALTEAAYRAAESGSPVQTQSLTEGRRVEQC